MIPWAGRLFPLLAVFSLHAPAAAVEKDVVGWLQAMVESVRTLNYQGDFVHLHDDNLELMRVIHTVDANGEKERLVSLNGAAREVVRDDASVTCIAPDAKSILINGRKSSSGLVFISELETEELSAYYAFQLLGRARVADRQSQIVAILPRDRFRYGYRLFLDLDSALPLKTDMLDTDGSVVSQLMFTSIQIDPSVDVGVAGHLDGREDYHWEQHRPTRVVQGKDAIGWVFEGLPAGFSISLQARIPAGDGENSSTEHFVLSDGLASLSVYVENLEEGEGLTGSSGMGAVNAFGRQVDGYQITAVGTVPAQTVEKAAMALRRAGH